MTRGSGPWFAAIIVGIVMAVFGFTYVGDAPGPGSDLDCAEIGHQVRVDGPDYHGLDRDGDGLGCEWEGKEFGWLGWLGLIAVGGGVVQIYRVRRTA